MFGDDYCVDLTRLATALKLPGSRAILDGKVIVANERGTFGFAHSAIDGVTERASTRSQRTVWVRRRREIQDGSLGHAGRGTKIANEIWRNLATIHSLHSQSEQFIFGRRSNRIAALRLVEGMR